MSEYLEWQPDDGALTVRVHRRVLAGLEREGTEEFRGALLGSSSPDANELLVEDFVRSSAGSNFDPGAEWSERPDHHTLPVVGYFRAAPDDEVRITEGDRENFAKFFKEPHHVLLVFQLRSGRARLVDGALRNGGLHVVTPPLQDTKMAPLSPLRLPLRERARAAREPEPVPLSQRFRGFLLPAVTVAVGFLIGVGAYVSLRSSRTREVPVPTAAARAPAPAASSGPAQEEADRSSAPGAAGNSITEAPTQTPGEIQREIRDILRRWSESLMRDDINAHVSLYASVVSPFFTKDRASRADILDEIRDLRSRYGRVTSNKISEITVAVVDPNHAIANFRKRWDTSTNRFSGVEREQLKFTRENREWLITSEQELQVYFLHKR